MLALNQDSVNLIAIIAVIYMVPLMGMLIACLLVRQIRRFGFTHSWGDNARDMEISGF